MRYLKVLFAIVLLGAVVSFFGLRPHNTTTKGEEARKRISKLLHYQLPAESEAEADARWAWPGESEQYYTFSISPSGFADAVMASRATPFEHCLFEPGQLLPPPNWFTAPPLEGVIYRSEKQAMWYDSNKERAYLYRSSIAVDAGCAAVTVRSFPPGMPSHDGMGAIR